MTKPADVIIANQTSTNARTDINNVNVSLVSNFTRSWNGTAVEVETTEPTQIYSNMWWSDTDNELLKIRADGNDAWISVAYLDQTNDKFRILDDTQVVDTSGTQTGLLGDQATATWETGTGTTESLISPAKLKAAIVAQPTVTIVRGATSTATTSLTHVASHGQSSRPDFVWGEVIITTAQHGYAVGDCIKIGNVYERDEDDIHMTLWGNATQMGLSTNTSSAYRFVANRSTGADAQLTGQSIRICGVWYDQQITCIVELNSNASRTKPK